LVTSKRKKQPEESERKKKLHKCMQSSWSHLMLHPPTLLDRLSSGERPSHRGKMTLVHACQLRVGPVVGIFLGVARSEELP